MSAAVSEQTVNMLEIVKEEEIAAPIDVVFETILEEMGPRNMAETTPMPMKLEAWPGGRWFRDLGNGAGHWWGTVQSIKPPSLIEIYGPLFMSYPAASNVQYRLKEENGVTVLKFTHRAMAWISYDPQIKEQLVNVHAVGKLAREDREGVREEVNAYYPEARRLWVERMMSESKIELWLVRHGETEWSLDGRHTSVTDIPLTERGRERARELRDYLAGKSFAAVFVSPMQRAKETCAIAGYGDVAQVEPNLTEWNDGESEGKTTAEMRAKYGPEWSVWKNPIVGGESVEQVGERADKVIARAVAAASDAHAGGSQVVALFAHAHVLRILAVRWIGLPAVDGKMFALGTGSLSVLGFEREQRVVSRWNRSFEE